MEENKYIEDVQFEEVRNNENGNDNAFENGKNKAFEDVAQQYEDVNKTYYDVLPIKNTGLRCRRKAV